MSRPNGRRAAPTATATNTRLGGQILLTSALDSARITALDIHEIEQLSARYTHAIDTWGDTGYQYADLYAPDGVFIDMWSDDAVKAGGVKWRVARSCGR